MERGCCDVLKSWSFYHVSRGYWWRNVLLTWWTQDNATRGSKGGGEKARTKSCENPGECTSSDLEEELMAADARRELLVVRTSWTNGEKTRSAASVLDESGSATWRWCEEKIAGRDGELLGKCGNTHLEA
ncbi:hypothetical protein Scep_024482 [Stephania cephalantha]|uniref:Uncharacterized protein n=1 Tax=Stephania cephalantha TaxID=152367 RepID=A0AAP0HX60_9MAGN